MISSITYVPILALFATLAAAVTSDPCVSTTTLSPFTVTLAGNGQYQRCYTTVYDQLCPTGLYPHTYTLTQTCDKPACHVPTPGVPPPGFTHAAVACSECGVAKTTSLTLPVESIPAYQSKGYLAGQTSAHITAAAVPTGAAGAGNAAPSVNAGGNSGSNGGSQHAGPNNGNGGSGQGAGTGEAQTPVSQAGVVSVSVTGVALFVAGLFAMVF